MKDLENDEILRRLRGSRIDRETIMRKLYYDKALKGAIMRMLLNNKGSQGDYEKILSHTLTRFYKACIVKKSFELKTNYINYLLGIANFVWLKELKVRNKHASDELKNDLDIQEEMVEIKYFEKERRGLIKDLLDKLGKNCREVLMLWSQSYSMIEIAEQMNYKSPGMAKQKKHKCIREMYSYLEQNPDVVEDLK